MDVDFLPLTKAGKNSGGTHQPIPRPGLKWSVMEKINNAMTDALSDNVFPGGVLLVSVKDRVLFFEAYGSANRISGKTMTRETFFDLASLTKPLATTLAVMKLVQEG